MTKNTRWQIFNKINKEGWVSEHAQHPVKKTIWKTPKKKNPYEYYVYSFLSPDESLGLAFHPQALKHHIIYFRRERIGTGLQINNELKFPVNTYKQLTSVSYKDYLRFGSEGAITEALM